LLVVFGLLCLVFGFVFFNQKKSMTPNTTLERTAFAPFGWRFGLRLARAFVGGRSAFDRSAASNTP
jgi:hypothetical protein